MIRIGIDVGGANIDAVVTGGNVSVPGPSNRCAGWLDAFVRHHFSAARR
jgi:hypothetical protein